MAKVPIFVTMIVGTIDSIYGGTMTGNTGLNAMPTIVHPSTFARCAGGIYADRDKRTFTR
jgi:hypothetical protein